MVQALLKASHVSYNKCKNWTSSGETNSFSASKSICKGGYDLSGAIHPVPCASVTPVCPHCRKPVWMGETSALTGGGSARSERRVLFWVCVFMKQGTGTARHRRSPAELCPAQGAEGSCQPVAPAGQGAAGNSAVAEKLSWRTTRCHSGQADVGF